MSAQIFCTNLAPIVTDDKLHALFSRFVEVHSAKVMPGRGRALNGFVTLINDSDIAAACELDGYLFFGRPIVVKPSNKVRSAE